MSLVHQIRNYIHKFVIYFFKKREFPAKYKDTVIDYHKIRSGGIGEYASSLLAGRILQYLLSTMCIDGRTGMIDGMKGGVKFPFSKCSHVTYRIKGRDLYLSDPGGFIWRK